MPARQLQQQLEDLRNQLAEDPPLSDEDKVALVELMGEIEVQLAREIASAPDAGLIEEVNLAVERFEVSHPTLTVSLRSILQTLANMGI